MKIPPVGPTNIPSNDGAAAPKNQSAKIAKATIILDLAQALQEAKAKMERPDQK